MLTKVLNFLEMLWLMYGKKRSRRTYLDVIHATLDPTCFAPEESICSSGGRSISLAAPLRTHISIENSVDIAL